MIEIGSGRPCLKITGGKFTAFGVTDWFQRPMEQLRKVSSRNRAGKNRACPGRPVHGTVQSEIGPQIQAKKAKRCTRKRRCSMCHTGRRNLNSRHRLPMNFRRQKWPTCSIASLKSTRAQSIRTSWRCACATCWRLGRAGTRIQDMMSRGIDSLLGNHRCSVQTIAYSFRCPVVIRNAEKRSFTKRYARWKCFRLRKCVQRSKLLSKTSWRRPQKSCYWRSRGFSDLRPYMRLARCYPPSGGFN